MVNVQAFGLLWSYFLTSVAYRFLTMGTLPSEATATPDGAALEALRMADFEALAAASGSEGWEVRYVQNGREVRPDQCQRALVLCGGQALAGATRLWTAEPLHTVFSAFRRRGSERWARRAGFLVQERAEEDAKRRQREDPDGPPMFSRVEWGIDVPGGAGRIFVRV